MSSTLNAEAVSRNTVAIVLLGQPVWSLQKLAQRKRMFEANQHRLQVGEESIPAPMPDAHKKCLQGSRGVKRRLEAGLQAEHERAEKAAERAAAAANGQDDEADNPKKQDLTYVHK